MLYDISPVINASLAVWPGDTPPEREVRMDLTRGDPVTLSTLRATVHLGSHADAPSHYGRNAPSIEQLPLDLYLGPCRVIRVAARRGDSLGPELLPPGELEERVLFATGTAPDPAHFNRDFATLSPALVEELGRRGVRLVGTDAPSVDPVDSKDLPAHAACLRQQIAILEGLLLAGVPEGSAELIALPLRLEGFDASPVRAVLRR
jgi:arylformamidase